MPDIADQFTGCDLALSMTHAQPLLAQPMPAAQSDVAMEPGERFVVRSGIAQVHVTGVLTPNSEFLERYLGWSTYHGLADSMNHLTAMDDVAAIALICDSPGGTVIGLGAAAEAIAAAAAVKPVHALAHPMAFSAAYWLASQATDITMTPGAEVGSIGVMSTGSDPVGPGVNGFQWSFIRSAHARAKNADATTEKGRALIQERLDLAEARFHAAVAAGRGISADDLVARISMTDDPADGGGEFKFQEALAAGLVDREMTPDAFMADLVARYAPPPRRTSGRSARALAAAAMARAAI